MKFSIITCAYNSEKFIQKNIDSVKNQFFRDFEHIFIDGNSSDNTVEIIKKYQNDYPDQVKLYQFSPKGISNAMNKGINMASGEYLIHLHSDDSFYDNKVLEDINFFLEENDYDWIYGIANVVNEDGSSVHRYPNKKFFHFHNYKSCKGKYLMKLLTFVPHQAVFIKKEVFDKFGKFDESITSKMDPDMWKRINYKTKWSFFNRIICNYCVREDAQSSGKKNWEENKNNLQIIQKRHLNRFEFYSMKLINKIQEKRNKGRR